MYPTLKANLEHYRQGIRNNIFGIIEDSWGIHLGVGDKFLLIKQLEDYDYQGWPDLQLHVARVLKSTGYESQIMEKRILIEDERNSKKMALRAERNQIIYL